MRVEIEKLEDECLSLEKEKKKLISELNDCKEEIKNFNQISHDAESKWMSKEKKLNEMIKELREKIKAQEKEEQEEVKELEKFKKENKELNDLLIAKNKENTKLKDGNTFRYTNRRE